MRCQARTTTGSQCKRSCRFPYDLCNQHKSHINQVGGNNSNLDFLIAILQGWQGLSSMISWDFGKEYLDECPLTCAIPSEPPNINDWNYKPKAAYGTNVKEVKQQMMNEFLAQYKPKPNLPIAARCKFIGSGPNLIPEECIK